jgi:hypothetical protein
MPRKLKVFRTPIGFHDAYVAAPSRKAALEARQAKEIAKLEGARDKARAAYRAALETWSG